jgi:hypothetical protein
MPQRPALRRKEDVGRRLDRRRLVGRGIELVELPLRLHLPLRLVAAGLGLHRQWLAADRELDRHCPAKLPGEARVGVEEADVVAARLLALAGAGDRDRREPVDLAERRNVVSSVGRAVSGAAGRLRARPRERRDDYAFCAEDGHWFRPRYTEGKCPLCGKAVPGGAPPLPLLARSDRSWLGLALLALESLGMIALVLFMYFSS